MAATLDDLDLSDPADFTVGADRVADDFAARLGDDYARFEGEGVYLNAATVAAVSQAITQNALLLGLSGKEDAAIEVVKLGITLNALVAKALDLRPETV